MKRLRTIVAGLGRVGWEYHVPQIMRHDGFDLVAVVDPLDDRRAEALSKYDVKGYAEYVPALESEKPDLVVIASPTQFHAAQAIAAFERGVDVYCDKPVAADLVETDSMIASANHHGRRFMVYQPHRATAEVVALKAILAQDLIGPVYMMKRACSNFVRRNDWQAQRRHAGGMLNNFGAHYVDQLLYVNDYAARKVSCQLRTIASLGDADDVVKAVIETMSSVILDVDVNMAAAQPLPPWQVLGRRGSAVLDMQARAWKVRYCREEDFPEVHLQQSLAAEGRRYAPQGAIPWQEAEFPLGDYAPVDFYQECYNYFALDKAPFVPLSQTRELMRVLDLCRKDSEG